MFTLPLAKEMIAEFGDNVLSNSGKWIKARVSFTSDVLNNIRAGAITGSCKQAERDQALELIAQLGNMNLYLFGRGYFGRQFLEKIVTTGCRFCSRLQRDACREVIAFIQSSKKDRVEYIQVEGQQIKVRLTKVLHRKNIY